VGFYMTNKQIIIGLLRDKPIAYHADLAKMLRSVTAGVFLSQLIYWDGKGHDPDGWIHKTQADWYEETGLTRREQETARKILRKQGIVEEQRRGQPARLYYRINWNRLIECLKEYYSYLDDTDPDGSKSPNIQGKDKHSSLADSAKLECTNAPNWNVGMRHSIYTENTTEITHCSSSSIFLTSQNDKNKKRIEGQKEENINLLAEQLQNEIQSITGGPTINEATARRLVSQYNKNYIWEKIAVLRNEINRGKEIYIGRWFSAALKHDYQKDSVIRKKPEPRQPWKQLRQKQNRENSQVSQIIEYQGNKYTEAQFLEMYNQGHISEEVFRAHAPKKLYIKTLYMN